MVSINSATWHSMSSSLDVNTAHQQLLDNNHQGGNEIHTGDRGTEDVISATGNEEISNEHQDISSILAYLLRSGQVRIPSSENQSDSSFSDEDDFLEPIRPPPVDPSPDTSRIKENDIYEAILLKSGRSSVCDKSHTTVPHMIYKRQIGMKMPVSNFGIVDRRVISAVFLPNYCETVAFYRQKAFCGTYSVDGKIFLSAAQDQKIRIYDTSDNNFCLKKSIKAKDVGWSVLDTAFSPDGNFLAYSSWSDCIHLCNLNGDDDIHMALHLFPLETSFCIFSLTFSLDNREILGGANDGHLYVFDRDTNQRSLWIDAHDDDVNAVGFADMTSQILFSGGDDGLCKVWDRRTLQEDHPVPVGILAGHCDGITYIDSKRDGRYFLSNSKDQTVKLWDIRMFSTTTAIEQTKRVVSKQKWDYRWQQVPRKMNTTKRLKGDTSVMTYRGHSVLHTLIRCHFSPEFSTGQRYVYTGCAMGNAVIYDTLTGDIIRKLEGHRSCVRDVSWHPYDNYIVTTSWDGTLRRWEYKTTDIFEQDQDGFTESYNNSFPVSHQIREQRKSNKQKHVNSQCSAAKELGYTTKSRGLFD